MENAEVMLKGSSKPSVIENVDLFEPKYSYLLGFMWADSYLPKGNNSVNIEITKEDGDAIDDVLCSKVKWKKYYRKREKRKEQVCYHITDKSFKDFIISYEFSLKSGHSPCKILGDMDEENRKFFIRGYFDGDGNIYTNSKSAFQITFCSCLNQDWKFLESIFTELSIKYSIRRTEAKNSYSVLRITNKKDVCKFYEYFYLQSSDAEMGLSRKVEKLVELYRK